VKGLFIPGYSYAKMNQEAGNIPRGSDGLRILPFGNGAERMLGNRIIGAHFHNIDLNVHTPAHIFRATQEGIAFAFRYGLDIMRENGMHPSVIRAGKANLFLSQVFLEAFVNATGVPVELHTGDGSVGAAIGAGIGSGVYSSSREAFQQTKDLQLIEPDKSPEFNQYYEDWLALLHRQMT
jgi:xylulokinase